MPTIKIEYYKSKLLSNGEHPIRITVTHKGRPKGKTIASCLPEDWSEDNKKILVRRRKDANIVNREISDAYDKYYDIYKKLRDSGKDWNAEDVFKETNRETKESKKTYWEISDEYAQSLKIKSGWTYITFSSIYRKFKLYVNNDSLLLSEIDTKLISGYINYCRQKGNNQNTINRDIKVLRQASNYGTKLKYDAKPDSLHEFKLPSKVKTKKSKISKVDVDSLLNLELSGRTEEVRDMWVFAFYMRGMRISDILQIKESYINGSLMEYRTQKNKKNFSIKLPIEAQDIAKKYMNGSEYLFSLFTYKDNEALSVEDNNVHRANYIKSLTVLINNELEKISKLAGLSVKLSTHKAKHSFSKYALDRIRLLQLPNPTDVSMALLGHSSLAVHETYVTELMSDDDLNNAADKIFE